LEAGCLGGAGLDVFPEEPHVPARLLALRQVTLTPHVGTNTHEARQGMAEACAQRIIDALEGRATQNIVNRNLRRK
ncbi:MAG: D-glycerate dehydrogenase, partial [Clostridia bacterium]|nr:D-glycerate dehydrogenase [Clostridia bacterium]